MIKFHADGTLEGAAETLRGHSGVSRRGLSLSPHSASVVTLGNKAFTASDCQGVASQLGTL